MKDRLDLYSTFLLISFSLATGLPKLVDGKIRSHSSMHWLIPGLPMRTTCTLLPIKRSTLSLRLNLIDMLR